MGLPLESMYAKSHDNYYIPVHSRVFSFFFLQFVWNKHSKKVYIYITLTIATLNLDLCL